MFAYKATNKDMTCLGFQYELGKVYEIEGELVICENGFHFCKNLKDIDRFYDFHIKNHRYFLVEIPDDAEVIDSRTKSVTNKIKFVRELTAQDWKDHGMIREVTDISYHYKDSSGYEQWYEYNEQGNEIHYKNSNGFEVWYEYDEHGNEIHSKDSNGYELWSEYNDQGKLIHHKDSEGFERRWEYNDQGKLIHFKNSNGFEESY